MKNIESILKEAGIEITDEQKDKVLAGVKENYKPIADYNKQVEKVDNLTQSLADTQEALKAFDGVDADALKKQIAELEQKIEDNENAFNNKMADRDFNDLIDKEIASVKGKNAKAIKALLNLDDLKASKNQKDDIAKAIKALTEADDSKMLFGGDEPKLLDKGDPIGAVHKDSTPKADTLSSALAEHYK